jgi:hypothetical protein
MKDLHTSEVGMNYMTQRRRALPEELPELQENMQKSIKRIWQGEQKEQSPIEIIKDINMGRKYK